MRLQRVAIPGREYPLQDVTRVNMAVALHYALEDLEAEGNIRQSASGSFSAPIWELWWIVSRRAMTDITR